MNIFKNKINYDDIDIILKNYNFGNENNKIKSYHDFKNVINLKDIFYCDLNNLLLILAKKY
jgi:hypothetical protein